MSDIRTGVRVEFVEAQRPKSLENVPLQVIRPNLRTGRAGHAFSSPPGRRQASAAAGNDLQTG